ncbi:MAG: hypothetical protein IJX44_04575 [Bacteroidaceae bacterium]|nr:hypothetical protein [Bacteroidaceae bacterium]
MRKNIVFAIVSIIVIVVVINLLRGCPPPPDDVWVGNRVIASFPKDSINEKLGEMPAMAELHIDASGSMKPYFRAEGTSMINTLSEIVNLDVSGTSIYHKGERCTGLVRDILKNISETEKSDPNTLFHEFFESAACKIDTTNTIIYLVTDGIMSIHDRSKNMSEALVELSGKIKNSLEKHPDLAGAIFRYVGGYKGVYWNCKSDDVPLKEQIDRPYYIIALGSKETMRWLESVPVTKLNNPDRLFMGIHDLDGHKKATLAHGENTKIQDINNDVTLILDLPKCLHDIDVSNVVLTNNDSKLKVDVIKEETLLRAIIPPTIPLRPESDGRIKIELSIPNIIPNSWIGEWNCDDDTDGPDSTSTFGLGTLVTGMFNGLEKDSDFLSVVFTYKRQ